MPTTLRRTLVRYLKFVAVATFVLFALLLGLSAIENAVSGKHWKSSAWETAAVFLVISAFVAALIGVSRPVFPYIRDPDRDRTKRWR
jgi:hypothetical protein